MIAAAAGQVSSTEPSSASLHSSGTAASIGCAPETNTRSLPSIPIIRSRQPAEVHTNWRIGSASKNSLATSSSRSEEHTSELQSLMRISYAVFCLKKKKNKKYTYGINTNTTCHSAPHKNKHKRQ